MAARPRYAVWAVNGDDPEPANPPRVPDPVRTPRQSARLRRWANKDLPKSHPRSKAATVQTTPADPEPYRRTCCRCLLPCRQDYRRRGVAEYLSGGEEFRYTCEDCLVSTGDRKKNMEPPNPWRFGTRAGRMPPDEDANGGWGNVLRAFEDWDDGLHDGA